MKINLRTAKCSNHCSSSLTNLKLFNCKRKGKLLTIIAWKNGTHVYGFTVLVLQCMLV